MRKGLRFYMIPNLSRGLWNHVAIGAVCERASSAVWGLSSDQMLIRLEDARQVLEPLLEYSLEHYQDDHTGQYRAYVRRMVAWYEKGEFGKAEQQMWSYVERNRIMDYVRARHRFTRCDPFEKFVGRELFERQLTYAGLLIVTPEMLANGLPDPHAAIRLRQVRPRRACEVIPFPRWAA